MNIINKASLASTLENLNEAFLNETKLNVPEKKEIAGFIVSRQGLPGSYWNMFAPTEKDYKGFTLFTGDKLTSRASIAHILGEESLRALYLLGIRNQKTEEAINKAKAGLQRAFKSNYESGYYKEGFFCCGKCTAAYWRNLTAEGTGKNKKTLIEGLKILKSYRDGKGRWKRFPFHYTILALTGIDLPSVREELRYAEGSLIRIVSKKQGKSNLQERKRNIAIKALEILSQ